MGFLAFVVKEISCGLAHGGGAVVHGNEGRSDLFSYIIFCESAVLGKHIHFNAVSEGFVNYHSRHLRLAYALVGAGSYRLGGKKLKGGVYGKVQTLVKLI